MTQRRLASVLFAVLGVYLAALRLPEVIIQGVLLSQWDPEAADPSAPVSQQLTLAVSTAASLIAVILGLALVILRDRIAGRLFSGGTEPLEGRDLQAVALSVLGSYFVVQGVFNSMSYGAFRWGGVVQFVLGLALFFGAGGLARLWARGD